VPLYLPLYLLLDLWMAYGFDSDEFDAYVAEHGPGDTWGALLDVARGPRTPCAQPLDQDDWCVFREGHGGPCYGADDVGPPNELLARYWSQARPGLLR
jgi:hypothetical protein